ncbi:MAG TPA: hypothetical protein VFK52_00225 [Nocardioidaceae bacterium]|nr:hypothetical protein [Nocardioidaceae bacterium]
MNIKGVPESITRQQVVELLTTLGIDAGVVTRHGGVRIHGHAVTAEVYALNEHGERYIGEDDCVATHLLTIRIVEDRP